MHSLARCVLLEKPKKAGKGVMLNITSHVIKNIWYYMVGYILGLGTPEKSSV